MAGRGSTASVADKFNLTDSEAEWVERQVAAGATAEDAALSIRSQRIGPASEPDFRPLPAEVAEELSVAEAPFEPVTSDDLADEAPFEPEEEES